MGRRKEEYGTNPSWFTPKRLLVMFCVINMLNYVDRGVIASNGVNGSLKTCTESGVCTGGTGIQGEFKLNNFEDGILSSAFMVGLFLAAPIFASLAKRYQELANRVDEALGFMAASGLTIGHPIMTTTEFWTSHGCFLVL